MKKILIIALIALAVVTGGMFAYTFTTATATIGVTAPTSDFANVTANSSITAPSVFGKFTGTWPSGPIFFITPDPEYTGDLVITVSLVNTGELIRQYRHLNMALEFTDNVSNRIDEQLDIQVLNLENAQVMFTWNGTAPLATPYTVNLTGGGFRLHPFKTLPGGSYEPQIWLEITQR